MKAILVIDMPDYLKDYLDKIKVFYAIGTLNGQELFHRINQPLKPMPQTRDVGYPIDDYAVGFSDGWDAFKKEITE